MGILGLFKRRSQETPGWFHFTVLCVSAGEGLSPEHGFALKNIISASQPLDFFFFNPGSFNVFFPQTPEGSQAAEILAQSLRQFARANSIPKFGVGIENGLCLAEPMVKGGFKAPPVGQSVSSAMATASLEAQNAL